VTGDAEMLRFEEAGSSLFQVRFRTKKPGRGGRQPGSLSGLALMPVPYVRTTGSDSTREDWVFLAWGFL
jgi:hypothetical protein